MIDAKMPEGLPQWMKDHVDRYIKSGGPEPTTSYRVEIPSQIAVGIGA